MRSWFLFLLCFTDGDSSFLKRMDVLATTAHYCIWKMHLYDLCMSHEMSSIVYRSTGLYLCWAEYEKKIHTCTKKKKKTWKPLIYESIDPVGLTPYILYDIDVPLE